MGRVNLRGKRRSVVPGVAATNTQNYGHKLFYTIELPPFTKLAITGSTSPRTAVAHRALLPPLTPVQDASNIQDRRASEIDKLFDCPESDNLPGDRGRSVSSGQYFLDVPLAGHCSPSWKGHTRIASRRATCCPSFASSSLLI